MERYHACGHVQTCTCDITLVIRHPHVPSLVSEDAGRNGDRDTASRETAGPAGLVDCSRVTPPQFFQSVIDRVFRTICEEV